jgi:hypothetical protein
MMETKLKLYFRLESGNAQGPKNNQPNKELVAAKDQQGWDFDMLRERNARGRQDVYVQQRDQRTSMSAGEDNTEFLINVVKVLWPDSNPKVHNSPYGIPGN